MEIQQQEHNSKGAFFIDQDGEWVAEMTYVRNPPALMIIDHTEVDGKLGGQGVGSDLVAAAVKFARDNGVKIVPLCPFAKKVFDNTPDYADVRA